MRNPKNCSNCMFYSKYKFNNAIRLKDGYCIYPDINKNDISDNCRYRIRVIK